MAAASKSAVASGGSWSLDGQDPRVAADASCRICVP
jgi:hypothetical protein